MHRALAVALLSPACLCAWTHDAHADAAAAEALFQEGKTLMQAGNYEQGCPKLAESFRLDPATGALLALAICHAKQGRLATAWAEYLDVASRSKQEGREDRAAAATRSAGELLPRLSTITLAVAEPVRAIPNLEIRRDGELVGGGSIGTAVPVDPGEHEVVASAPGRESWSTTVLVAGDAQRLSVEIPELRALKKSPGAGGSPQVPKPAPVLALPPAESGRLWGMSDLQLAGMAAAGVGVIGIGIGSYFGIDAMSGASDTDGDCPDNRCEGSASLKARQDAVDSGSVSTLAFVIGGALVGAGAVLYVVGAPASEAGALSAQRVAVRPALGTSALGVDLEGSF